MHLTPIQVPDYRRPVRYFQRTLPLLLFIIASLSKNANAQDGHSNMVVDTSITGFHYATNFSGTLVYTQHGPSDINGHSQPSAFSITVSGEANFEQAKDQVLMLFKMSVQNGLKISDLLEKDTVLNGHKTYCISYTESSEKEKYQNLVFNALVSVDRDVLVFASGDLDGGKFIDLFKKTFYQLPQLHN